MKKTAQAVTGRALDLDAYRASIIAHNTLDRLAACRKNCPDDIALLMIVGANEQILGRPDQAAMTYQAAIQYDKRPELYLNLGLALAQAGRKTEATAALTRAATFMPEMVEEISDFDLRTKVRSAVAARDAEIRAGQGQRR